MDIKCFKAIRLLLLSFTAICFSLSANQVTFYDSPDFQGRNFSASIGELSSNLESIGWYKNISSMYVDYGICVIGYEKKDFQYSYRLFGQGYHADLANVGYDNEIASFIVSDIPCRDLRFSSFYTKEGYKGEPIILPQGIKISSWSDASALNIESMRIFRGQNVCLYTQPNWLDKENSINVGSGQHDKITRLISHVESLIIGPSERCPVNRSRSITTHGITALND